MELLSFGLISLFQLVGFIIGVIFIVSRLSGWGSLSRAFGVSKGAPRVNSKDQFGWVSARFRYRMRYNSCLNVGVSAEGLYLRVLLLMRIGHSPIIIPWSAVESVYLDKFFLVNRAELTVKLPNHTVHTITFENLRESVGLSIEEHHRAYRAALIKAESEADQGDESFRYTLDQR